MKNIADLLLFLDFTLIFFKALAQTILGAIVRRLKRLFVKEKMNGTTITDPTKFLGKWKVMLK